MLDAKDAVVWVDDNEKRVVVTAHMRGPREVRGSDWSDPIGAAYSQWNEMTDDQRVVLMLETAIDLAMQGFDLGQVLKAFAQVREFRALGGKSYPMCRALTMALVGRCLEQNTMSFDELLERYGPEL